MTETRPVATCGVSDTAVSADRLGGCGEPIDSCAEVFRCVDCELPFHRGCARHHFATQDEKDRLIEKREDRIILLMDQVAELLERVAALEPQP